MASVEHEEELMTTAEVARKLRVSEETVRTNCRAGKWPSRKIGPFYRFTTEDYLTIITPPVVVQKPRTQRKRIDQLLRAL